MKSGDETSTKVAIGCVTLLTLPLMAAWRAFVLAQLWAWFAVVQFGVKPLSLPMAYGISLMVQMFSASTRDDKDDRTWQETMIRAFAMMILAPAITLFLGWLAKEML